jgi:hypothetical protein
LLQVPVVGGELFDRDSLGDFRRRCIRTSPGWRPVGLGGSPVGWPESAWPAAGGGRVAGPRSPYALGSPAQHHPFSRVSWCRVLIGHRPQHLLLTPRVASLLTHGWTVSVVSVSVLRHAAEVRTLRQSRNPIRTGGRARFGGGRGGESSLGRRRDRGGGIDDAASKLGFSPSEWESSIGAIAGVTLRSPAGSEAQARSDPTLFGPRGAWGQGSATECG